mmetsp:Transcript_28435/g.55679  ORF Transcript_28435/g.55679 Transcript_28435/m.55679 type:complete len:120 (+) Transcript_28435:531-890(+)
MKAWMCLLTFSHKLTVTDACNNKGMEAAAFTLAVLRRLACASAQLNETQTNHQHAHQLSYCLASEKIPAQPPQQNERTHKHPFPTHAQANTTNGPHGRERGRKRQGRKESETAMYIILP